jgi:hypothetical protein
MTWIKKNWIILFIGLLVIAGGFYFMKKNNGAASTSSSALGETKGGRDYFEADVQKGIASIKGTPTWFADVKTKAEKNGRSLEDQLRLDAIYMLEFVA